MRRMNAAEFAEYLKNAAPLLIDVREPWEFDICHIEHSRNIPMGQIPVHIEQLRDAGECAVICHHGVRSLNVIRYLKQQGIDGLINLDGGVDAWAREIDRDMALY